MNSTIPSRGRPVPVLQAAGARARGPAMPRHASGFTLIELLVVMFIASILLAMGVPAFNQFMATNRMAAAVNDFVASIHVARSEAVKRGAMVTLCTSSNWDAAAPDCTYGSPATEGWLVFIDTDGDIVVDGDDLIVQQHAPMQDQIMVAANPVGGGYLSFDDRGFSRTGPIAQPLVTDIRLCDHRGNADIGGGQSAARWIQISQTGRPQVYRMVDEITGGPLGAC